VIRHPRDTLIHVTGGPGGDGGVGINNGIGGAGGTGGNTIINVNGIAHCTAGSCGDCGSSSEANKKRVIAELASAIGQKSFTLAIQYAANFGIHFTSYAPEIIKTAFNNNVNNIKKILFFVKQLASAHHDVDVYSALLTEMKKQNALKDYNAILFAVSMQQTMRKNSFTHMSENDKQRFLAIKNSLPENVRNIVAKQVLIKSAYFKEYLFTDFTNVIDTDRRQIYTAKSKSHEGNQFRWTLDAPESFTNGFSIRNAKEDYMYAAYNGYNADKDRRKVFMWMPLENIDESGEWVMEPVANSNKFLIKHRKRNEYLYPLDDGQNSDPNRKVYTWIPGGCDSQCEWEIKSV
jgi:hypothetical protein